MKPWQLAVAWMGCLAVLGCRTDPNIKLLEQELRLQEDRIWQLQSCVEERQAELDSCRRENRTLNEQLQGTGRGERRPTSKLHPWSKPAFDRLQPPSIELPSESETQKEETPDGRKPPPKEAPPWFDPEADHKSLPRPVAPDNVQSDSTPVDKIVLSRPLTGGYDADGRPGDEGIAVVIEPRDAAGELVAAAAPVSVVVIDPALEGEAARAARWDFTDHETAAMYGKTLMAEGIHLELPWPEAPPVHRDLHLYVRYTTTDGRELEADRKIKIDLPANPSGGWSPAKQTTPEDKEQPTTEELPAPQPQPVAIHHGRLQHDTSGPKRKPPVWSPNRE